MRLLSSAMIPAFVLALATAGHAQTVGGQNISRPADPPRATANNAPIRDPEAIAALERMGAYLRSQMTFSVSGDITTEDVLETGQSLLYTGAIDLVAQRPGHLRVNLDSSRKRRQYYYDGRTLTIYSPRQGFYASMEAPPTIHEMLETAGNRLNLAIPLVDLFELGTNPELTNRITSAFLVGTEAVEDQTCTHYAFRQANVDWEMWIREGEQPLPCMYRITSLDDPARPDYTVRLTWDLQPVITADTFNFVPPEGADRIPVATASLTGN